MSENDDLQKRIEEEERVRAEVREKLHSEKEGAEKAAAQARAKKILLWVGGVFIALTILAKISGGPDVLIEGDVGKIERKILSTSSLKIAGFEVAGDVYAAAKEHPELKKIVVSLYLVPVALQDKYGKDVSGDQFMGEIKAEDLDEVRKYEKDSAYQVRNQDNYAKEISRLAHAYVLEKD